MVDTPLMFGVVSEQVGTAAVARCAKAKVYAPPFALPGALKRGLGRDPEGPRRVLKDAPFSQLLATLRDVLVTLGETGAVSVSIMPVRLYAHRSWTTEGQRSMVDRVIEYV